MAQPVLSAQSLPAGTGGKSVLANVANVFVLLSGGRGAGALRRLYQYLEPGRSRRVQARRLRLPQGSLYPRGPFRLSCICAGGGLGRTLRDEGLLAAFDRRQVSHHLSRYCQRRPVLMPPLALFVINFL